MKTDFYLQDIKILKIKELKAVVNFHQSKGDERRAQDAEKALQDFRYLCTYATDEMILEEVQNRLKDYYQIMAGYYYSLAEDFPNNPFIKIESLKKAIFYCNKLKELRPEVKIYANRWICRTNRNYYLRQI